MNLVKGKNIVVSINLSGIYYPIFCTKTFEIVLEQDEIEVTSVNSGADREYEPGMSNQTFSCTGIHVLDNTGGNISANYLRSNIRRLVQQVRVLQTDDDGAVYIETFSAFVKTVGISRETSGYGQASVNMRISGQVTSTTVIPPNPDGIGAIYKTVNSGNTVSDAILSGKTILEVEREGIGFDLITGTPVNRQVAFSGTTLTFDAALPFFSGGETVYVLYQS